MNSSAKSLSCFFFLLTISLSCMQKEKTAENELVTIDVTQNYPAKKMVLQDIADVEYIRLDTPDDLLWQGEVNAFTDRYILNHRRNTGEVLFFDRTGKGIKKINRQGGSGEEYSAYSNCLLDEENEELYFDDLNKRKILVYDLNGEFKRVLDYIPGKRYENVTNFDTKRLIVYNSLFEDEEKNSYLIISKATGEIEQELIIPQTERKLSTRHIVEDGDNSFVIMIQSYPMMTSYPDFILMEISNDTIFSLNRSMELRPIVIQQPSRPTMNAEAFLFYAMDSRDYLFFFTIEKKFVGEGFNVKAKSSNLVYDKKEKKCYQQDIQNGDFTSEKKMTIYPKMTQMSAANKNVFLQVLNAADLVEAYENNELTGKLKEIAKDLDEEDNPVLLVARFK